MTDENNTDGAQKQLNCVNSIADGMGESESVRVIPTASQGL
jgi:hypothetical protein